tara:strand:+ start:2395 stop:7839 length:5445 start_codon:yes stop_codon:yes gene_type:complete
MANATSTELQELYIAYFGRAADPTGLDYWTEVGTTTKAFAASMHAQPEFKDVYGSLSTEAQVNQIYKNLFDRAADVTGLTYWTQQINLGKLELAEIAVHLIYAAKNNAGSEADKAALSNRTSAAIAYTAEVKLSTSAILAYAPENAGTDADADWISGDNISEAVTYLSGIDGTTAYTAAGVTESVNKIIANGTQNDKKTFVLTTGLNNFTGGDSSDTFDASTALSLNNGDTLDGGGGTDTITAKFSQTTTAVNSKNIEKFVITATGTTTLNFADTTGVTSISNQGSTAGLTINSLNSIPTYELNTNAQINAIEFADAALSGSADEFKVTLSGTTDASDDNAETLTITRTAGATNDLETLHLVSSTVANAIETVTTSAVDTTTLKVSGDQNLVIRDSVGTEITSVDASAATGDITVITGYTKATTVTGGSGSDTFTTDAGADTISGGAGNDVLDGGAGNDTIDGGAGNDTLTSSGTASLTGGAGNDIFKIAAASYTNSSTYKGGDGTDSVEFSTEAAIVDADFSSSTSIEEITFSSGIKSSLVIGSNAAAMGLNKIVNVATGENTLTTVGVDFTNDLEIVVVDAQDDITASAFTKVLTVDVGGATLATTNSIVGGTGTTDVVEFSGVTNATSISDNVTGFEKLVVKSDTTSSFQVANNFGADGASITIDGSAITSTDKVFTVDASREADAKVTIIGGAGNDIITITSSDNGDSITGGTGNDTFKFTSSHYTSADTISGGAGDDTLELVAATAVVDADFTNTTSVKTITASDDILLNVTLGSLAAAAGLDTVTLTGIDKADVVTAQAAYDAAALRVNLRGLDDGTDYDSSDGAKVDASAYTGVLTVNAGALVLTSDTTITGGTGSDTLLFTGTGNTAATLSSVTKVETIKANSDASASILINTATAGVDESLHIDGTSLVSGTSVFTVDASGDTDAKISITGGAGNDVITISGGAETDHGDTISGGAGNDTFKFATGKLTKTDTIKGGAGTDSLEGTTDGTTVADIDFTGVTNVEEFTITAGSQLTLLTLDSVAAAAGLNKVVLTADGASHTVNVTSGFSNDLTVDLGADSTAGAFVVNASTSTSTAYSGVLSITAAGTDMDSVASTITGGSGLTDTITISSGGTPLMTSVTNIEKVVLATAGSDATITLVDGNATYTNGTTYETITIDGSALTTGALTAAAEAEVDGKVIIIGGAAADSITLDESTNFGSSVTAGAGNDTIITSAAATLDSADTVSGGAGTDTFKVDTNSTTLTDVMFTNFTSVETLTGDADAEVSVTLGAKADAMGLATVNMTGTDGGSVTVTSAFDNALTVDLGDATAADNVDASASSTTLSVTAEAEDLSATDTVKGGTGTSDSITLTADDTTAYTTLTTGIETITVKYAANKGITVAMGANDTQIASGKTLTVTAAALTETDEPFTFTGSASETDGFLNITGGTGNDTITGAADNDTIAGGSGVDSITGGKGADSITGGAGADTFVYAAVNQSTTNSYDNLSDWTTGTDKIQVTLDYSSISSAVEVNAVQLTAAAGTSAAQDSLSAKRGEAIYDKTNEKLLINVNNDNLFTTQDYVIQVQEASTEANSVVAGDINNIITTTTGDDTITSGDGADTISGGTGADSITAGGGADSIIGGSGADTITGGAGADYIQGDAGADVISLGSDGSIDNIMLSTSQTLNGTDTITGFDDTATGDTISFNFGETSGLANLAALRGDGTDYQEATQAAALDANIGLLVYKTDITSANAADAAVQGMTGEATGDIFFAIFSTDVSASTAVNTVYRCDFSATNTAVLTSLATFVGELDDFSVANSGSITTEAA